MRTQAILHPPVLDLPPPLDARVIRTSLTRTPRPMFVTAVLAAPSVVRVILCAVVAVIRRLVEAVRRYHQARVVTRMPRGPPEGEQWHV